MANPVRMPSVDELRLILRSAMLGMIETQGNPQRGSEWIRHLNDRNFARNELSAVGAAHVYDEELRRSELIERGFSPPDDLPSRAPKVPVVDQSRARSAVEVATNTATGLIGSWLIAMAVMTHVEDRTTAATITTALCTLWSLTRGWLIRRAFNRLEVNRG